MGQVSQSPIPMPRNSRSDSTAQGHREAHEHWNAGFPLARQLSLDTLRAMKTAEIKGSVERQPFRPFAIRLNNGAQYTFRKGRDVGATKDYHILVFFGKSEAMRIDSDSILEIIERRNRMKCAAAPPDDGPPPNGWKQPDAFSNRSRTMCASSHFAESDAACFLASFTDPDAAKFPQRFYRAVSH